MEGFRSTSDRQDETFTDLRRAGPTAARMLVGAQLRRFRLRAGIGREEAGAAIRASESEVRGLELGRSGFRRRDVVDLLTLYGVADEAERQAVLELAEQAGAPGWWQRYDDVVPAWHEPYLGLEQAASVIRCYEVGNIPELLQTPDYTRAVVRSQHPAATEAEVARHVDLLSERQRILWHAEPAHLWAVIDETALRRPPGGVEEMRDQLRHLIEVMAELPNVTVQVLPLSGGGHVATSGPIALLRFPEDELPDIVFLRQLNGAVYLDEPSHTDRYRDVLDQLVVHAELPIETGLILSRIIDEI
ncbi:MAG TPA: helix-turn-helix transcriptional regulator [Streptosporangiaceae bacterium]